MATKVSYYTRSGSAVDKAFNLIQPAVEAKQCKNLYSIKDVVDVVLISADPFAMSISPSDFEAYAKLVGESDNPTYEIDQGNEPDTWDNTECAIDRKRPINTGVRFAKRDMVKLNPLIKENKYLNGWGKWDEGQRMKLANRWNVFMANMKNIDNAKKRNYFWPDDKKFKGCSQFSVLFQDVSVVSDLIEAGYQLPRPRKFTHRCNWLEGEPTDNRDDYSCYFIVMFLTVPAVLTASQIFNPAVSLNNPLLSALDVSGTETAKNIISETCSALPSSPPKGNYKNFPFVYECVWPFEGADGHKGIYYMGDSLKSANNKWRLMVTAHGDLWLQNVAKNELVAGFGSSNTDTMRATFELRRNGDIAIKGRSSSQVLWNVNLRGFQAYLSISDSGILVVRAFDSNIYLWSNKSQNADQHGHKLTDYFSDPLFYFADATDFTTNTTRYSPNLRYSLSFQSDGNLVLRDITTNIAIWSSETTDKGKTLRLEKGGQIRVLDSNNTSLWSSNTASTDSTRTILVADNNGAVVVMAKTSTAWIRKWSYPLGEWNALYAGGGAFFGSWTPYLSKSGDTYTTKGIPTSDTDVSTNISTFNARVCSSDKYTKYVNQSSRISTKAAHCMTGYNLIVDRATCNIFSENKAPLGDGESVYKKQVDTYVTTNICNAGYESRFSFSPNLQNELNKLCSCISPLGYSKTITANNNTNVTPICFDINCTNDGYKTLTTLAAKDVCPKCMCMNTTQAENTRILAGGIKQTCPTTMDCTKIDVSTATNKTESSGSTSGTVSTSSGTTPAAGTTPTEAETKAAADQKAADDKAAADKAAAEAAESKKAADEKEAADKATAAKESEQKMYIGIGIGVFVFILFVILLVVMMKRKSSSSSGMDPMMMMMMMQRQSAPAAAPLPAPVL
jgi:hypothetical protein